MRSNYLKSNDEICLLAPARKISEAELLPAVQFIENQGFTVRYGEHLFAESNQFAGTDEERAADFQAALDDPNIKAIWCVRGGYGSVRIIDRLDFTTFCKRPKWICGFSDTTVFHSHLQARFQIPTIHSTMPVNAAADAPTFSNLKTLISALKGEDLRYEAPAHPLNRKGSATAPIVGGNLSILYALSGSTSDIDTSGKILLIEDLDEYLYHIDRMMMQLKRSGKLANLAGLVVGGMSDMHDNAIPFGSTALEIVAEHCRDFDFPIAFNFPVGHGYDNVAIRLGMNAQLTVTENVTQLVMEK